DAPDASHFPVVANEDAAVVGDGHAVGSFELANGIAEARTRRYRLIHGHDLQMQAFSGALATIAIVENLPHRVERVLRVQTEATELKPLSIQHAQQHGLPRPEHAAWQAER